MAVFGIVAYKSIDNFGHLGGLLTGAIYGFFQIPTDLYKDPRQAGNISEVCGLAALGIFIAVSIFSILLILRVL